MGFMTYGFSWFLGLGLGFLLVVQRVYYQEGGVSPTRPQGRGFPRFKVASFPAAALLSCIRGHHSIPWISTLAC
ncbi:hypothetical protein P280DRAFT_465661 [Massarina eburnea CBS 473.64]|uniref:Uncharacterized protein n=1 Tax=Massarina eburnea CBS 473.64 TaxID=1395130 RepID=A0A6A6SDF7_9PLEO|nr:hypothetical protein P280DRAFT_465661 [Massarina eburnea CBS 473.64]